jgi:hypothetical protein
MCKDRFTICNDAAELQVTQEEIWGRERRKVLIFTSTNPKMLPPPLPSMGIIPRPYDFMLSAVSFEMHVWTELLSYSS